MMSESGARRCKIFMHMVAYLGKFCMSGSGFRRTLHSMSD